MAGLWTGTTLNNNVQADVFNQLFNTKAIEMVRKENALLYMVLGKSWRDKNPAKGINFERLEKTSGKKVEIKLLGLLDDLSGNYVADGSDGLATATVAYTANALGAVEFDWAHIAQTKGIPADEFERIQGKEAKTLSYMDEVFNIVMLSLEKEIGTNMNAANAPARNAIAGWPYMVSDGTSAGEAGYASYGLDRSDAANADYRGTVTPAVGDLTFKKIRQLKNIIRTKGGKNQLGVCETSVFTKIQDLVESYTEAEVNAGVAEFGFENVKYGNTTYLLEKYGPAGVLGLLDPESFVFYLKMINFTASGFVKSQIAKDGYILPWAVWVQFLCAQPSRNGKLTGINT